MLNRDEWKMIPSHTPCIWLHEQQLFLSLLPFLQKGCWVAQLQHLIIQTGENLSIEADNLLAVSEYSDGDW
jgi:hypothetical protein